MLVEAPFAEVFQGFCGHPRPLAAFYSVGEGFIPLIATERVDQLSSLDPREILSFEANYTDHLIVAAFPFEFGVSAESAPAQLSAFPAWVRFDSTQGQVEGVNQQSIQHFFQQIQPTAEQAQAVPLTLNAMDLDSTAYQEAIRETLDWIRAGEIYQLNYTTQLKSQNNSDPRACFLPAIKNRPPAFSALVELEGQTLLSLSPERFLQTQGRRVYTDPIKGTGFRDPKDLNDHKQAAWLRNSEKEAAELNMITDLLRNDLGQICQIGSVKVEQSRSISTHPGLLHTHSRISGKLKPPYGGFKALLPLLPGGSISGCPKSSSLRLIKALETEPRGFYTGSLGYRLPGADLCFNLLIRTLIFQPNQVSLGVGGGITLKSNLKSEVDEARQKAKSVLSRFITL